MIGSRPFLLTVIGALLAGPGAVAEDLSTRIGAVIDGPEYRHGRWGVLVVDAAKGRVVYEHNADQLFLPASTTKLYSCSAALHALGPNFRFETPVYRRGSVEAGHLHGDLILVASGDLTLGGRTLPDGSLAFTNTDHTYADATTTTDALTPTDPLAGLNELAKQVKAAGIDSVEGDVLIDARLFEPAASSGSGPRLVTPIVVNDNVIDVIVTAAAAANQPAAVSLRPETAFITLDAQVQTTAEDRPSIDVSSPGHGSLIVRGHIPLTAKPQLRIHAVEDPATFARTLLIEALRRRGVAVTGSPLREPRVDLPERDAYARLTRVAAFTSPPFSEAVKVTLKVSQNNYASSMPLLVAAKHGERTLAAGLRRQRDFLRDLGIDRNSVSFAGGAGGDRADATTPRATVSLLQALAKQPEWSAIEAGLPVLGKDGTLATAANRDGPASGHVHAKTGTLWYEDVMNGRALLRSKALAGMMTTARGTKLIYAMFVNDVPLPQGVTPSREGRALGHLCEIIYEHAD
ncbi:MAG TPA: D-alanyl-D-alanine carboxypeptidase/D-alanyl-D-alanine-endopeptidase [Gemmataceae bacterium]|nr:D-alanyl-D-alanine carboxypeptidase/D-alanyl-D-alanine-endopeptidase [Gemmataceae bacterium]